MLFEKITIVDEGFSVHRDVYVGVEGAVIDYIGEKKPEKDYGERYSGAGRLLIPGMVNAHSHAAMTLLRGYAENLALDAWLNTRIFPFEAKMNRGDIYAGAMLAFAEMLRFGTTSATDMYCFGEQMGQAVVDSGIKCNVSLGVTCFDKSSLKQLPKYDEYRQLLRDWHNAADGRYKLDLSMHAEYTSHESLVREMADFARETGLRMHIHLSETKKEHEECKVRRSGKTPAEYFLDTGLFDAPTTAAHCVWLEGDDFDILKEKGVTVANNPVSNLKLASGVCNVPKLLSHGVNVALGTDSVASNNNLSLFEELKLFAILYKGVYGDPTLITPSQALYAATRAGALSQGRGDCGCIRVGNRADLVVIDADSPVMHPQHDLLNNLIYSCTGSEVLMTMVDGRVLYQNGEYKTIDIERVVCEADQRTARILSELR